jgi:hypothetical protein
MSERPGMDHSGDADEPMADDPASNPGGDLELLAITNAYIAAYRAGQRPRLSDFAARYPAHAVALADFATRFLADAALDEAEGQAEPPAGDEPASARPLSAGTRRALDALFGSMGSENAPAYVGDSAPARLPSVAETPAPYTSGGQSDTNDERPARGAGDAAADDDRGTESG